MVNACDLYRNINPFTYSTKIENHMAYEIPSLLAIDKKTGQTKYKTVDDKWLSQFDAALFVRYYTKENLPLIKHIVDWCVKQNKPIYYETDDLLHLVEQNTNNKEEFLKRGGYEHLQTTDYILSKVQHMTVSTQPLKDYYSKFLKIPITVCPNYYDPKMWTMLEKKPRTSKAFRVGWAGGKNHYQKNFSILEKPLNYLKKKYKDNIEFVVFCQDNPNQDWYPGHENKFDFEFEWHQGVGIYDYPQALADLNLDLGLVVVEDNEFSRAKSNIKWMEYGLLGLPCVASDVLPYQKTTALLVKNKPKDWINAIELLMTNKKKYGIMQEETIKTVKEYNVKQHVGQWEEVYQV